MNGENIGLILEGGGLRGVYTAGVLDLFIDKNLYLPYIVGVSAGACQSFSYVSKQRGRSYKVNVDYIKDPRYLSVKNYIRDGSIFGMDFMFDEIPKNLIPFDYVEFENTQQTIMMGVTNCLTGKAEYFDNKSGHDMFLVCRASSSLPLFAKEVKIGETPYLDGGMADPIPIRKAITDGYKKNIVILTRNDEYRKRPSKYTASIMKRVYKLYPNLVETYKKRAYVYNETLEYIKELEESGEVFVIRPLEPVKVGRTEKDTAKLKAFYNEGYAEAENAWPKLVRWMG